MERKLNYLNIIIFKACIYIYIYRWRDKHIFPPPWTNYYSKLMKHVCLPRKFLLEICSGVVCDEDWKLCIIEENDARSMPPSGLGIVNYFGNWRCEESVNVKV